MYQEQSKWKKEIWVERREIADERFLGALLAEACIGRTVLQPPLETNVSSGQEHYKVNQIGRFMDGLCEKFWMNIAADMALSSPKEQNTKQYP